jgi:hypothetical protein
MNDRDVNMKSSHFEYFIPNLLPDKILLNTPANNTYVNSQPELKWLAGTDPDFDPLTYDIEIDESGGDWSTLIDSFHTKLGALSWKVTKVLNDGQDYQWRVRADDSSGTGPWSDTWQFTVDAKIEAPLDVSVDPDSWHNTNSFNVSWTDPVDVSGIVTGAYYSLNSQPRSAEDGYWVDTKPITEITVPADGVHTIYVWLKDNAGNIDHTKIGSTSVYLDTAEPFANKPRDPGAYNNTGTVRWRWEASSDTGSGISGYYVSIGTFPGGTNIAKDVWTTDTWFEKTDLEDLKTYYCKISSMNGAGTIGSYSENSDGILVDMAPPTGLSILINDDADYTESTEVALTLAAEDFGSGLYQMAFSTDGVSWDDWVPFKSTKSFSLSEGDGTKTVFFKVSDNAGNIAEPVFAQIILNTSPPILDSDNDGCPDDKDAFPDDPSECLDTDNDGYGDNIDVFPEDTNEWLDTDGDKIGNNADPDDDNDGLSDTDEKSRGLDPLLKDTDGDGYDDGEDTYPLDSTKWEKKTTEAEKKSNTGIIAGVIVIVVIVLILLFLFIIKPRISRTKEEEAQDEPQDEVMTSPFVGQTPQQPLEEPYPPYPEQSPPTPPQNPPPQM